MELINAKVCDIQQFHNDLKNIIAETNLSPAIFNFGTLNKSSVEHMLIISPIHVVKRQGAFQVVAGYKQFILMQKYLSPKDKLKVCLHRFQGDRLKQFIRRLFLTDKYIVESILSRTHSEKYSFSIFEEFFDKAAWKDTLEELNLNDRKIRAKWANISVKKLKNGKV